MYEEIIAGREDDLTRWLKDNREALLLDETVAKTLVARVTDHGYASDLTGEELERVGRDPFLIAYALRNPAQRLCCMVRARNRSGVEVADDHSATAEDCASPSANILFSTVHPTIASRCCASNPFARRLPPRIRLYRRTVPSTRACCR